MHDAPFALTWILNDFLRIGCAFRAVHHVGVIHVIIPVPESICAHFHLTRCLIHWYTHTLWHTLIAYELIYKIEFSVKLFLLIKYSLFTSM